MDQHGDGEGAKTDEDERSYKTHCRLPIGDCRLNGLSIGDCGFDIADWGLRIGEWRLPIGNPIGIPSIDDPIGIPSIADPIGIPSIGNLQSAIGIVI